jgi:hypothetical protein
MFGESSTHHKESSTAEPATKIVLAKAASVVTQNFI